MYLSQIASSIVNALATSPPETWAGSGLSDEPYVVGTDTGEVEPRLGLDPFTQSGTVVPKIFVIMGYIEYRIDKDRRARRARTDLKYITIALSIKISGQDTEGFDVTNANEQIKLVDLKEDLDKFLVDLAIDGAQLEDIETEPPGEFQLKDSYFLATTVLGYTACSGR